MLTSVQFYISCAQLSISGSSASADAWEQPAQIPGVFSESDPGYTANVSRPLLSLCGGIWITDRW